METYNFNNKTFSLVENSENGKANSETRFEYKQEGNLVTADYFGGSIIYGKIISRLEEDKLIMLYQCLTNQNELKAGKAIALISLVENNKIKLKLNWEWLGDKSEKGVSEYLEN
ncbi:MAG: n-acetylglutamate synthase [Saprospiraceae bacterium]|nr:n-acetylglutamate synthase [Saprospiraceae bacterium]